MSITIDNIDRFIYLFRDGNSIFPDSGWTEPVFVAMLRAYQNDDQIDAIVESDYIRQMIHGDYREGKTYSPVEHIADRSNIDLVSAHTADIMLKNFPDLGADDRRDLRDYLRYLFTELMNNVIDHSGSAVGGYTMAQYFGTSKKIQFVVADRGVGFLDNMRLNFPEINTESDAIGKAFEKGVTSTRQTMYDAQRNAGFGLYAMLKIMEMTDGRFVVISNDTLIRYSHGNFDHIRLSHPWKGVVVAFEFDEANINYDMDYFKRSYLWGDSLGEDEDFF